MTTSTHFGKEDIGGEILPFTTGLYRNTLDALREYIQIQLTRKQARLN